MFRAVGLQAAALILAAAVGGLIAGSRGCISSALGGAAYLFPNLLFALHLKLSSRYTGAGFLVNFVLGELVKLVLTVGSLFAVVLKYGDVHMPSMLIGLALVTQAVFFWGFWKKKEYVDHGP